MAFSFSMPHPIAWNVAAANRSKGNFPSPKQPPHWRQRCSPGSPPSQRRAMRRAKSLGVSSRGIDNRHKSCRIGATKTPMVQHENRIDNI